MGQCCSIKDKVDVDGLIVIDDIRRKFGDFHLLGDGGSSNVFSVLRREDQKQLALKKMSRKCEMNMQLFKAEAAILEELNHRHIVHFEEVYMDRKNYYIVTQLCTGGDLLRHIKEKYTADVNSKITESFVAHLITQVVDAIEYCHSKNVVHRDIKPENFVFLDDGDTSELMIIDFGIAKIVQDGKSYSDLVGTPYYIAPEYLTQSERTAAELKSADIWSIGVVAYVLCTGRPPFHGNTNEEVFRKVISKPLKFPRKARLSSKGKSLLKTILRKNSKERPTAAELKDFEWLNGGAEQNDLDVVQGLISFDLKTKMRRVVNGIMKESVETECNIQEVFENIDKNGDGNIDLEELKVFLKTTGYAACNIEAKAKEIMEKLDVDKSGELDIKEFEEAWVEYQLSTDEKVMAQLFDYFDANGDGQIDASEMKLCLGENSDDMKKVFDCFDQNSNGEVSYDEFSRVMREIGFTASSKKNAEDDFKALFANNEGIDFSDDDHDHTGIHLEFTDQVEKNMELASKNISFR